MSATSKSNTDNSIWARLARRLGFRRKTGTEPATEVTSRFDDLSGRLQRMRGENITVVQDAGKPAPNRDGVKHLSNAARDARYIDRSNEDEAVSDLRSYRTSR